MRSAMIDKDVATASLVDDALPWKMVWRVRFLDGPVIRTRAVYDTEDEAFAAADQYVAGN